MSYQEIPVSSVADIPAAVAGFASGKGWTVGGTTLTRSGGGESFTLSSLIEGQNNQDRSVIVTRGADTTKRALLKSPKMNGTSAAAPFVPNPTKVHCFAGGSAPEPFLGIVVEFGYNQYRHLYIGNVERLGNWTGGELISAANAFNKQSSTSSAFGTIDYHENQYLFDARQPIHVQNDSGGLHLVHADALNPWRHFYATSRWLSTGPINTYPDTSVMGGFKDGVLDGLLARGKSTWAGASILVPINLYAPRGSGADAFFVPLGRVSGIRMIRMDGLDPAQNILVGNKTWKVFPAIRKSESQTVSRGTWWGATESSYLIGYAYLTD